MELYHNDTDDWRRIDSDWRLSSARLALQLDDATNNTSLVLAFELADGRVLLFPADAQIGSWRSWLSVAFKPAATDETPMPPPRSAAANGVLQGWPPQQ